MNVRAKRKLFRTLRDALTAASVNLSYVQFINFSVDDEAPDFERHVVICLYEIQRKTDEANPPYKYATWEGTGRYRLQVYYVAREQRTRSFPQDRNGEFKLDAVVAVADEYVRVVRTWLDARQREHEAEARHTAEKEVLVRNFQLDKFTDRERVGWRNSVEPVEVEAHAEGLTLSFNRKLTATEARTLLHCASNLGLLPGGVREKDRTEDPDSKSRYERV